MFGIDDLQPHPCERAGCTSQVAYDDEPYCFTHSPDSGSYQRGYSWAASHPEDAREVASIDDCPPDFDFEIRPDLIVTYTGSMRPAWGRYVVVVEKTDDTDRQWVIVPLHRSEQPRINWLHVREASLTPCADLDGAPLHFENMHIEDEDLARIRWWASYFRPAMASDTCSRW